MMFQLFPCVWKISIFLILTGKVSLGQFRKLKNCISSSSLNIYQVPVMERSYYNPLEKPHLPKGETLGNPRKRTLIPGLGKKGASVLQDLC